MARAVRSPKPERRAANGEGSVRFNADRSRWEGRVTVDTDHTGQPVRRMVTGTSERDVRRKMREIINAVDQGLKPAPRTLTVGDFLDRWLERDIEGHVAEGTRQFYADIVRLYIKPHVGRKTLAALSPDDVSAMQRKLGATLSPRTVASARKVLRAALNEAVRKGMVGRNAAALAKAVKVDAPEGRTLTPDEAQLLLAAVDDHRLRAAFTVALAVGLRLGELLGLTWDDLDLDGERPRLTVRRALKRHNQRGLVLEGTKTAGSRRTVLLPQFATDALRIHRKNQLIDRIAAGPEWESSPLGADLVFRTEAGTAIDPDNFRRLTYSITERAGIGRWSPHELRHSCASLLIAQGVPLKSISDLLGHSSIRITSDVYGHLLEPARAEVADAMQRALGGGR